MNAIIHIQNGEIAGWIIGQDNHDLRRQLSSSHDHELRQLAQVLYRLENPPPGKHDLGVGYWLLVG